MSVYHRSTFETEANRQVASQPQTDPAEQALAALRTMISDLRRILMMLRAGDRS